MTMNMSVFEQKITKALAARISAWDNRGNIQDMRLVTWAHVNSLAATLAPRVVAAILAAANNHTPDDVIKASLAALL